MSEEWVLPPWEGIPATVMVAPMILVLTDAALKMILEVAVGAGCTVSPAAPVPRLAAFDRELAGTNYPERAQHVLSLIRQARAALDLSWFRASEGTAEAVESQLSLF